MPSSAAAYERTAQAWRRPPLESAAGALEIREIVRLAVLAASSHNTQPWRFFETTAGLEIAPDFARRCPVVDPDDAHLYKSLGCAAENAVHAAAAQGRSADVRYDATDDRLRVDLDLAPRTHSLELARAIPVRQCTKLPYDGRAVARAGLAELETAGVGVGVRTLLLTARSQIESVAEFVAAGDREQLGDPAFRRELVRWVRFNARAALECGDGIASRTQGRPALPTWLAHPLSRVLLDARRQGATDAKQVRSSAGIAVVAADRDDRAAWIEVGRVWQRFALRATVLGIRTAFVNQPIKVAALRPQFASWLALDGAHPLLLVRFGYGPLAPYSLRRPLDEVFESGRAGADESRSRTRCDSAAA